MLLRNWTVPALFFCWAYLSLYHLDNTDFWDDEARVAIVARNFLQTGRLTAWDGRNLVAVRNGGSLDEHFRPIDAPLDILVAAASFCVFGASTWAGRLPFAVAGLLGLAVLIRVLKMMGIRERAQMLYITSSIALSPSWLLYMRQCRYYGLTFLFSLLVLHRFLHCIRRSRPVDHFLLACCAALLFYSHYLVAASYLLALLVVWLVFYRHVTDRETVRRFAVSGMLFLVLTLPYALAHQIWHRSDVVNEDPWILARAKLLWWNFRDVNIMGLAPWMLLAGTGLALSRRWYAPELRGAVRRLLLLGASFLIFLSLFSHQPTYLSSMFARKGFIPVTPFVAGTDRMLADIRYMVPLFSVSAILFGSLFWAVHKRWRTAGWILLMTHVSVNLFALTPRDAHVRWLLPAYLREVHGAYPTAYSEARKFLQSHATTGDLVSAVLEHHNYPLMFYLGGRLTFCCQLTKDSPLPAGKLNPSHTHLYMEGAFPDWVLAFGAHPVASSMLRAFSRPHPCDGKTMRYRYEPAGQLPVYWAATHRPELPLHHFGPRTVFDPASEGVYIFRRVAEESDMPESSLLRMRP